jgi:hypothetical protein
VLQLKERLQELLRVPVHCQRLSFDASGWRLTARPCRTRWR